MLLLVAVTVALAQDPAPAANDTVPTIVVEDIASVLDAREALSEDLTARGYYATTRRSGNVVFRHPDVWRPAVVMTPDGLVRVRRRGVAVVPPGRSWQPHTPVGQYLKCLTPWTLVGCLNAKGLVMGQRKFRAHERTTLDAIHPDIVGLQDALSADAIDVRTDRALARAWFEGVDASGTPLASPADRRAAIGALWVSRASTSWGDRARDRIETFVAVVVQVSSTPFTANEIDALQRRASTARVFAQPDTSAPLSPLPADEAQPARR